MTITAMTRPSLWFLCMPLVCVALNTGCAPHPAQMAAEGTCTYHWQSRECRIARWNRIEGLEFAHPELRARVEARAGGNAQCRTIIDHAVGQAVGNHSYGGICKTGDQIDVVCFDEMIGHFAREPLDSVMANMPAYLNDTGVVATFTYDHCFGG